MHLSTILRRGSYSHLYGWKCNQYTQEHHWTSWTASWQDRMKEQVVPLPTDLPIVTCSLYSTELSGSHWESNSCLPGFIYYLLINCIYITLFPPKSSKWCTYLISPHQSPQEPLWLRGSDWHHFMIMLENKCQRINDVLWINKSVRLWQGRLGLKSHRTTKFTGLGQVTNNQTNLFWRCLLYYSYLLPI